MGANVFPRLAREGATHVFNALIWDGWLQATHAATYHCTQIGTQAGVHVSSIEQMFFSVKLGSWCGSDVDWRNAGREGWHRIYGGGYPSGWRRLAQPAEQGGES